MLFTLLACPGQFAYQFLFDQCRGRILEALRAFMLLIIAVRRRFTCATKVFARPLTESNRGSPMFCRSDLRKSVQFG